MWHRFKMTMGRFAYGWPRTTDFLQYLSPLLAILVSVSFFLVAYPGQENLVLFFSGLFAWIPFMLFAVMLSRAGLSYKKDLPEYKIKKAKEKWEKICNREQELGARLEELITLSENLMDTRILETWLDDYDEMHGILAYNVALKDELDSIPEIVNSWWERWNDLPELITNNGKLAEALEKKLLC